MRQIRWVAAVGLVVWATGCTTVRRASDDARDGDVSVWLHTPFVTSGDTLVLEIGAFDDPKVGIDSVKVWMTLPEGVDSPVPERLVATLHGKGRYWGDTVLSSTNSVLWDDSDFVRYEMPVPETEGPIKLSLAVHYSEVVELGKQFTEFDKDASIDLTVPVMSPGMRTLRRTLSGLAGLVVLIAACLLVGRSWRWLNEESSSRHGSYLPALALLWFAIGYWWFAQRLVIATGWTGAGLRWAAAVAWLVIPLVAGWYLGERRRRALPAARVVGDGE